MEFDEDSCVAGHGSTFCGAIFMCNHATKQECFKRKIFALPASMTSFVKTIKPGMVLFLFEHEERKLYGVFIAASDGALNIEPWTSNTATKKLPAQIRFKVMWSCRPLYEHEFSAAIEDNYYTANKFEFYLSLEQVHKLLELFRSRRTKIHRSIGTANKAKKLSKTYGLNGSIRVTVTNDRLKNEKDMENNTEQGYLSDYYDLPKPNLNCSGYSKSTFVNAIDTMGDERLSLTIPCSSEFQMSNPIASMVHNDGTHVSNLLSSPRHHPYNRGALSFQYKPSSSFVGVDHNASSTQEVGAYSRNLPDSSLPFSRTHFHQSPRDLDDLNSSSFNYLSVNVAPNSEDYRRSPFPEHYDPSNASIAFSGRRSFHMKKDSTILGGYEGLSLPEQYEPYVPLLGISGYGKKSIMDSSFPCSPGKGHLHLCDDHYPAAFQHEGGHEGMQGRYFEPSAATVPLSEAERFSRTVYHARLSNDSDKHPSSIQEYNRKLVYLYGSGDGEGHGFSHPTHEEYFPNIDDSSFHSDSYDKKTSVFSRLSFAAEASPQDDLSYESDDDLSVSEFMEQLSQRSKGWWQSMKKSKSWNMQNNGKRAGCTTEMDVSTTDDFDNEVDLGNSDMTVEEGNKGPFLDFKRRSDAQKAAGNKEVMVCDGGSPGKTKRRKLIRPSFSMDPPAVGTDKNTNVEGEGNTKVSEAPIRNREDQKTGCMPR